MKQIIDVVGIFDQNYVELFSEAQAIKATVKPTKKPAEHPLENGQTITDYVIITPIDIEMSMLIPSDSASDVYGQIVQYFNDSTLLTVQTRSALYKNVYIYEIPHEEDTDQFGLLAMGMKLKQALIVTQQQIIINPKNPAHAQTQDRGNQQAQTPDKSSAARDIFNAAVQRFSL